MLDNSDWYPCRQVHGHRASDIVDVRRHLAGDIAVVGSFQGYCWHVGMAVVLRKERCQSRPQ